MPFVTVWRDKHGDYINAAREMQLDELERVIRRAPPAPTKEALPLLKFARFGDKASPKGSLRADTNVAEVHGIEGDYDAERVTMAAAADRLRQLGVAALLYTSASHSPERPRFRVLCPLSAPLSGTADELRDQRAHWAGVLNALLGGILSPESFRLSQSFFFGAVKGRPEPEIIRLSGVCLDQVPNPPAPVFPAAEPEHHDQAGAAFDTTTDEDLRAAFAKGDGRYGAMLKLSARWAARGMPPDDIEATLAALLTGDGRSTLNADGVDLLTRCRPLAQSAVAKFGDTRRAWPTENASEGTSAPEGWQAPVDFLKELRAPAFAEDSVPDVLGRFAFGYARQTGIDPAICVLSAVTAAGAALSDDFAVVADSGSAWMQPARIWALTLAPSGSGKTPAQKAMLGPLHDLQRVLAERHQRALEALGDDDQKPPRPRVVVADATVEALSEVLRDNPRGVLVANDEFEGFLGSLDQYKRGVASRDRGEWLRLFDGGPHTVERVQRGSVFVPNFGASLLTATTPTALAKVARLLPEDGLLQRFLVVVGRRQADGERVPMLEAYREDYGDLIARLWNARPMTHKGKVPMAPDAAAVFADWRRRLRIEQEAFDGLDPALGAHVAKFPTFALRLAVVFHACHVAAKGDAEPDLAAWPLSEETMRRALRFLDTCRRHAVPMYLTLRGGSEAFDLARELARLIAAHGGSVIERRDFLRRSRAFKNASPELESRAIEVLIDFAWLRPSEHGYRKSHPTRFEVNPLVRERFAALAERERARREVVRAAILEAGGYG